MAQQDPTKFFRVTVNKEEITVVRDPDSAEIDSCPVTATSLQLWTTQALVKMLREGRLTDEEEYRVLGANLYDIVFNNRLGTVIRESWNKEEQAFKVELGFGKGQNILPTFPWELLYCPTEFGKEGSGDFLAQLPNLILTRRLTLDGTPRSLRIETPPVRILFVASGPTGHEVEYESVLEAIQNLGSEMVEVNTLLPNVPGKLATWENFKTALKLKPHAIHFLGHGKWDKERNAGTIVFMKDNNTEDPRTESEVANNLVGKTDVRLVFLQACESAQSDPYHAFSGAAQQLAQKGIPAVVGMQSKINHQLANLFAREFYEALAKRLTVDAALQTARIKISETPADLAQRLGFGIPLLYIRKSDPLFPPADASSGQPEVIIRPVPTPALTAAPMSSEFVDCPWPGCGKRNRSTYPLCKECGGQLLCKKGHRVQDAGKLCPYCRSPLEQPLQKEGGDKFADRTGVPLFSPSNPFSSNPRQRAKMI
jgi:hypothetical protein